MKWQTRWIDTNSGRYQALAPTVISASRRTDIPALYPEWLANRLQAGWVKWINPYSGGAQYISFARTRAIVFWTKNPRPLLPFIGLLNKMSIGCYFQFTLNDYSAEGLEPGLPPLVERIETFRELSDSIGSGRIIWRFDPLILAQGLEPAILLRRLQELSRLLKGYTQKLVFSFAEIDRYPKVRRNLESAGINWRNFTNEEKLLVAARLRSIADTGGMAIAACAQELDLEARGIPRSACIDPELLEQVAGPGGEKCQEQQHPPLLPGFADTAAIPGGKDNGQRAFCGCSPSKDIGQYTTCTHGCLYCYANSSPDRARKNAGKVDQGAESLPTG